MLTHVQSANKAPPSSLVGAFSSLVKRYPVGVDTSYAGEAGRRRLPRSHAMLVGRSDIG